MTLIIHSKDLLVRQGDNTEALRFLYKAAKFYASTISPNTSGDSDFCVMGEGRLRAPTADAMLS